MIYFIVPVGNQKIIALLIMIDATN